MKKLYIYLLAGALISIFALGWVIDTYNQQTAPLEDSFEWQSKLITGLAKQVADIEQGKREDATALIAKQFDINISYKDGETLAMPLELKQRMLQPDGLVIENENVYLLKTTPKMAPDYVELEWQPQVEQADYDVLLTLFFYGGICAILWFILSPLVKRLIVLNTAAKHFASGNLSARIAPNHFTYIRDLENTFNRMASQIEKLMAENKLMASSLSHDIRTPVACLRFGLDAALDESDIDAIHDYLARMEKDLDQMEDMLSSYLSFATLEQKSHLLKHEVTTLSRYGQDLMQQMQPKLQKNQLSGRVEIPEQLMIHGDLHWLARAISNLISNACDFATASVLLSAHHTEHWLIITVEDDGPGIARQNWDKVFSPFFQEQTHRNRAGKSYGLGLAIVAKVMDWHHGTATVNQSERLGGAKFVLSLPCKEK
ncbi:MULTISPECIES: HAMP domain-containing sensor histidine kinase [Pseudoalteromonas]|uniref:sensor histidine kinase n=1 Tax=Pseudoalteromonas TaxID=53246 RepID=UPI0015727637|nr:MULTISPECIES: HAMP domain-containing sensor histidine kinase [Pseudoalteromonas]NSY32339.1 sensor histidine kinase [Pseudoalteromonas sp. JC28]MBR8841441.1 HAMP domain-containing histidine kinase [Pseudoalteromonas sp. JC3]QUI71314.1 two-component sensor histidine kinase [Pseudoalteromonas sp. M8]UDM61360.1 HAMP domain-containing histidine kinase [Pseudoalteromonas piscicida]WJE07466.1 HAMP domain-containing sensor histidine kinase [Pseudoalteromonas sp. JC3]